MRQAAKVLQRMAGRATCGDRAASAGSFPRESQLSYCIIDDSELLASFVD